MTLTDTHSHIYLEDFNEDIKEVIDRAQQSGITKILMPNIDVDSIGAMHRLADCYPDLCFPMMGLHPTSVQSNYKETLQVLFPYFKQRKYVAVGEIGIDLYWDKTLLKEQIVAFEEQLRWSIDLQLPVVIHNRESFSYVMESIHKVGAQHLHGVFHSFGGTQDELSEILKLENFYVSLNGVLTFKNSHISEVIKSCPLDRILVETDAPYLTPVPWRGKRNEPAYIWKTVEKLAETFGKEVSGIAEICSKNTNRLFG